MAPIPIIWLHNIYYDLHCALYPNPQMAFSQFAYFLAHSPFWYVTKVPEPISKV